jgi:Flp pilus assembly protein protease CpaA
MVIDGYGSDGKCALERNGLKFQMTVWYVIVVLCISYVSAVRIQSRRVPNRFARSILLCFDFLLTVMVWYFTKIGKTTSSVYFGGRLRSP